jgi:hypothetical protein
MEVLNMVNPLEKELLLSLSFTTPFLLLVLDSHDWGAFLSSQSTVLVVSSVEEGSEVLQVIEIFLSNIGQSEASGVLLVDKVAKSRLTFHKAEWNIHFSAQSWQEDHQFDWDDIMSNDNELGLLVLYQGGNVIETKFDNERLVTFVLLFLFLVSLVLGFLLESVSLLNLSLWFVLREQFEELVGLVLFKGLSELVDWGWHI